MPQTNDPSGFGAKSARQFGAPASGAARTVEKAALVQDGASRGASPSQTIVVKGFKFVKIGERAADKSNLLDADLSSVLEATARNFLSVPSEGYFQHQVALAKLDELALVLARKYREHRRVIAPVFLLGEQDVTQGIITFQIVEGRLESLSVADKDGDGFSIPEFRVEYANNVLRFHAEALKGRVLTEQEFERTVMILEDLTGRRYSAQMYAGQTPQGVSGSLVESTQAILPEFQANVRADNQGSPALGQHQFSASLLWRPVQTLSADQFYLSYMTSETALVSAFALGYEIPVGNSGLRAGLRGSLVKYELGGAFTATLATGTADSASAYLAYPLIRTLTASLDSTLTLSRASLEDRNTSTINPRDLNTLSLEFRGAMKDDSGGQTSAALGVTLGNLSFATSAQKAADTLGLQGGSLMFFYELSHARRLGEQGDITLMLRGQSAQANLDSYQKMSVGGINGVRAFAPTENNGDDAFLARLEIGRSFSMWSLEHRLAVFYDQAKVAINHAPTSASSNDVTLAGYGIQLQSRSPLGISSRLYWANPSSNSTRSESSVDGRSARIGFDLAYTF